MATRMSHRRPESCRSHASTTVCPDRRQPRRRFRSLSSGLPPPPPGSGCTMLTRTTMKKEAQIRSILLLLRLLLLLLMMMMMMTQLLRAKRRRRRRTAAVVARCGASRVALRPLGQGSSSSERRGATREASGRPAEHSASWHDDDDVDADADDDC